MPPALRLLVAACFEDDVAARPISMAHIAKDIERILATEGGDEAQALEMDSDDDGASIARMADMLFNVRFLSHAVRARSPVSLAVRARASSLA